MKKYEVIEDHGGGLILSVFDKNGNVEYLHSGYEFGNSGSIMRDIMMLKNDANPIRDWDGNEENPHRFCAIRGDSMAGFRPITDYRNYIQASLIGNPIIVQAVGNDNMDFLHIRLLTNFTLAGTLSNNSPQGITAYR